MAIICCTAKVLREFRVPLIDPDEASLSDGKIGHWYCNRLGIDRRKCLLFTNARTLYSFFVPGVKRPALNTPDQLFRDEFAHALALERLPKPSIEAALSEYREIVFRKTVSRSVLGSMNDHAFTIQTHVRLDGGLQSADLLDLHFRLNETPMSAIDMDCGRGKLLKLLAEESAGMPDPHPIYRD